MGMMASLEVVEGGVNALAVWAGSRAGKLGLSDGHEGAGSLQEESAEVFSAHRRAQAL